MIRLIILLAFFCSSAIAQSITGVSGTVGNASSVSVSGSGFGSNGPTVQVFDDFDTGTNGSSVSTDATYLVWDTASSSMKYSNAQSISGDMSATSSFRYGSGVENAPLGVTYTGTSDIFYTFWFYLPVGSVMPGDDATDRLNYKMVWSWDDGTTDDDVVAPQAAGWMIVGNDMPYDGTAWGYIPGGSVDFSTGEWMRMSVYMHAGFAGDSVIKVYRLNPGNDMDLIFDIDESDGKNLWDNDGTGTDRWVYTGFNQYGRITYDLDSDPVWDDLYLATGAYAQARIEIGNNANYLLCTNMTICTPTAWSDTLITTTINQGSFVAEDTAYIFVVDADGSVSTGYPITIGGTASSALSAPSNLRQYKGN